MSYRQSNEFRCATELSIAQQDVNNDTVDGAVHDLTNFQGDLEVIGILGTIAATSVPEFLVFDSDAVGGPFVQVTDSDGNDVIKVMAADDDDQIVPIRVRRDILRNFVRVSARNTPAANANMGVVVKKHEPKSPRDAADPASTSAPIGGDITNPNFTLYK